MIPRGLQILTFRSEHPYCDQNLKIAFSFKNIFLVLEILTFFRIMGSCVFVLCFPNESDDVMRCATKMVKYWIKNISRNIELVFFKIGTRNVHQNRNKMTPFVPCPSRGMISCMTTLDMQYPLDRSPALGSLCLNCTSKFLRPASRLTGGLQGLLVRLDKTWSIYRAKVNR